MGFAAKEAYRKGNDMRYVKLLLPALLLVLIVIFVAHPNVTAQQDDDIAIADEEGNKYVVRIYDVSDLLIWAREYPNKSNTTTLNKEEKREWYTFDNDPGEENLCREMTDLERIIYMINDVVGEDSWDESYTGIHGLGKFLEISQTPANHKRIETFLDEYRKQIAETPSVAIETKWLVLKAEQLDKLVDGAESKDGAIVLKDDALAKAGLTEALGGVVTCISGKTANVISGPVELRVINVEAVVAENSAAYDPETKLIQWGSVVEVTPYVCAAQGMVILNINGCLSFPQGDAPRKKGEFSIEDVKGYIHVVQTQVRLPLGKLVLVGGGSGMQNGNGILVVGRAAPQK